MSILQFVILKLSYVILTYLSTNNINNLLLKELGV